MGLLSKTLALIIAVATTIAGVLGGIAAPAAAAELGDLVDYELVFPVEGSHHFSDWFWARRSGGIHQAQDIMAAKMTPVVAAADGTIRLVNWSSDPSSDADRCCSVVLTHNDGWETQYIHLNNDTPGTDDGSGWGIAEGIVPGVDVVAGTLLGWVGDSGNAEATAPHLHFELLDPDGVHVNPFRSLALAGGNWLGWGPADPLFDGSRPLRQGFRGADVRRLQEVLEEIGISAGSADAIFGPRTAAAVRKLQTVAGITVDGIVGRDTRAALDARYEREPQPSRVLRRGDRGADVVHLQQLLRTAGHDPGYPDGIFGSRTDAAVRSFQAAAGLVVDGIVGVKTKTRLNF